ncbi:MAG: hypothetical protein M0Z91_14130 [Actinomycetota bacterium]|nr:hypothetical protein [Actinomycetota bacterium]
MPMSPGPWTSSFDQSQDKRSIKLLNVVDEYGRRWLSSLAARSIDAAGVIATLDGLVAEHGVPKQLRMDIILSFVNLRPSPHRELPRFEIGRRPLRRHCGSMVAPPAAVTSCLLFVTAEGTNVDERGLLGT